MITYDRSAFGWKLIFKARGSAFYRSIFPSLAAVIFFYLFRIYITENTGFGEDEKDILHPYAVGVLVTTSTFLIVFKLNQSYNRYWEACGSTFHFMSKWMDATTHTSSYHMQCAHYAGIRPPSYFDYPELNYLFMTRDRERMDVHPVHKHSYNSENGDQKGPQFRNRRQSKRQSSQRQNPDIPPIPSPKKFAKGNADSSVENGDLRGEFGRKKPSITSSFANLMRKKDRDELKQEYKRRAIAKSINTLDHSKSSRRNTWQSDGRGRSISSLHSIISNSSRGIKPHVLQKHNLYDESVFHSFGSEPIPLVGKPRLDGNWGNYYTKNPKQPLSTFVDPHHPDNIDSNGFASIQGGRTPPLFLQELAHLSSLLTAVALSTLRNDMEECESPLGIYKPGQPWPEVDPNKDELTKVKGFRALVARFKTFFSVGLTSEQRSKYNAAQPLPVIGGVSDAEIRFLQLARGPYAKTQLCFNWLSEFIIREHLSGSLGDVAPPIISRIFQFLGDGMIYYNHSRKIMFIPFPFGHAQLSVIFVLSMVIVIPFLMHQYTEEPLVGAILTFMTVLCLQGINEVARDLENPFRNFPNELPLVNFQAQFNEGLMTMYAGYHPDFFWDGDQVIDMARASGREASRKSNENGDMGTKSLSDSFITNNVSINAKPQTPDGNHTSGIDEGTEVAALKFQLEYQAKLIEELYGKIGDICGNERH